MLSEKAKELKDAMANLNSFMWADSVPDQIYEAAARYATMNELPIRRFNWPFVYPEVAAAFDVLRLAANDEFAEQGVLLYTE
jgi:hypothetical protein